MASGNSLNQWGPQDGLPPASNYATLDSRNNHLVADYDAGTNETLYFEGFLPRNYSGGGLTVTLVWVASSSTSGNVVWDVAFERHQDGVTDIASDSFASAQSVTSAAPGTSGIVKYADIAFTNGAQIDDLAAGEHFRISVTRNAASGSDTMTGDADLLGVAIREN